VRGAWCVVRGAWCVVRRQVYFVDRIALHPVVGRLPSRCRLRRHPYTPHAFAIGPKIVHNGLAIPNFHRNRSSLCRSLSWARRVR
jgi:hypothetical protein